MPDDCKAPRPGEAILCEADDRPIPLDESGDLYRTELRNAVRANHWDTGKVVLLKKAEDAVGVSGPSGCYRDERGIEYVVRVEPLIRYRFVPGDVARSVDPNGPQRLRVLSVEIKGSWIVTLDMDSAEHLIDRYEAQLLVPHNA